MQGFFTKLVDETMSPYNFCNSFIDESFSSTQNFLILLEIQSLSNKVYIIRMTLIFYLSINIFLSIH